MKHHLRFMLLLSIMMFILFCNICFAGEDDKIHFIAISGGDAFLIESNGHFGLIDSANPPSDDGTMQSNPERNEHDTVVHVVKYLKSVGVNKLDFVLATHSHSDHIGGMPEIARNFVDENTKYYYKEYVTTREETSHADWDNQGYYDRAVAEMKANHAQLVEITNQHPKFTIGDFEIQFLNTETPAEDEAWDANPSLARSENHNSIVTLLKYQDKKVIFASDMCIQDEKRLIQNYSNELSNADVLKMGHHGINTSTCIEFAKMVNPRYAIISSGAVADDRSFASIRYFQRQGREDNIFLIGNSNESTILTFLDELTFSTDGSVENMNKVQLKSFIDIVTEDNWETILLKGKEIGKLYYENGEYAFGPHKIMVDGKEAWFLFHTVGGTLKKKEWEKSDFTNQKWIYADIDGKIVTGWKKINGAWYYFSPDISTDGFPGVMLEGWKKLDSSKGKVWFYFAQSEEDIAGFKEGQMVTGRQLLTYNGKEDYYYFAKSSTDVEGYVEGAMVRNITIEGHTYGTSGAEIVEEKTPFITITPTPIPTKKSSGSATGSTSSHGTSSSSNTQRQEFIDVTENDWFYDAVTYAVDKGLFHGISETEFAPNQNISRGMLVTVLYRYDKANESEPPSFTDVEQSKYYAMPISWAEKNQIVNGIGENCFAPDKEITREELATMIARYLNKKNLDFKEEMIEDEYEDQSQVADYAVDSIYFLRRMGLMKGRTDTIFAPKETATRAEVATLMKRLLEK